MENNTTKVEMIKPVFIKAGIPIAITLVGYIIAKITTKKISNFQISPIQESPHDESGQPNLENSESLSCIETNAYDDDHCSTNTLYKDSYESFDLFQENPPELSCSDSPEILQHPCRIFQKCTTLEGSDTQSMMTLLKNPINLAHEVSRSDNDHYSTCTLYRDLQEKCKIQEDIEAKFQQYTHLKEKEIALMDMQHKLILEINKVDFLSKEITLMEAENQRFQYMVIEYLRIMELLDLSKSENSLLHKRVKKLLKKIKESSRVMKEQKFQLEAKEKEISRNQEGQERKDNVIKQMELEIQKLKMEKAETSNQSKSDVEMVTIEDYKELANGLEQLQKDKASEDSELIYLRWCNACLRHELMRRNQEQMEQSKNQELNREIVEEFVPKVHEIIMRRSSSVGHNESCSSSPTNDHSKRKNLIQKFKKWVEGSDHKVKHETNCFKRHSVSDHTEELILPARKSCSSA